jgi:peptidoglycan/LPS O-acetylase OafA/YrhL
MADARSILAEPDRIAKVASDFLPLGHHAHIDGIRAIAIIAVIGFDTHIPGFRGGFVGIDMFFVISGFLITYQIAGQLLDGRFSATDFYARRILRIVPPLLLVTVVTVAVAPLFPLLPQEGRELAKSAAAAAAMVSNYYFSSSGDYFSPQAEINPLLHTWSLGIGAQYCLLAPAFMAGVVWLAARRNWDGMRALSVSGVTVILVSHIIMAILSREDERLAFFSIMSRAWQFVAGGTVAIAVLKGALAGPRVSALFSVLGLAGIAAAVLLYDRHIRYLGPLTTLLPTIGTVLLLAGGLGNKRAPISFILASRPAVVIGVLSYSWYLWHWPVIELMRSLPVAHESIWKDAASSSVALLLSIPTYFFLERPMKMLRRTEIMRPFGSRIAAAGLGGSALIAVLALVAGRTSTLDHILQEIPVANESITPCGGGLPIFRYVQPCRVGQGRKPRTPNIPNVMVMGDAHAEMLRPAMDWFGKVAGKEAMILALAMCPPLQGVDVNYFSWSKCAGSNDEVFHLFESLPSDLITGTVLAARWSFYNGKETPGDDAALPRLFWSDRVRSRSSYSTMMGEGLADLIRTLGPDMHVLIVGPIPELERPIGNCLQRAQLTGQPRKSCTIKRSEVELRHRETWQVLHLVASKFTNVRLIDPVEAFCDRDTCRPFGANGLYYVDKDRLSVLGIETLYRHFAHDFEWVYEEPTK